MTQSNESKWKILRNFIDGYLQEGTSYRAGSIYQAYLNEGGSSAITRKDFEMFLRDQVMKDDGLLKRVAHGVYEIRTDPNDRGVLFTRGSSKPTENTVISLDEILDDSVELATKIKTVVEHLDKQDDVPFPAQMEMRRLKALLTQSMDTTITGVTAVMAWCDDNLDMDAQDESESMNIGGMNQ